jgi:hypothetical protein
MFFAYSSVGGLIVIFKGDEIGNHRNKYRMISYRILVVKAGKRTLPNIFDRLYFTARWRCGET